MVSTQNSWKQSYCYRNVSECYKYFEFVNPGMLLQIFLFNFFFNFLFFPFFPFISPGLFWWLSPFKI